LGATIRRGEESGRLNRLKKNGAENNKEKEKLKNRQGRWGEAQECAHSERKRSKSQQDTKR